MRRPHPIVAHVLALVVMTTLTNASALMASTFGPRTTLSLATATLILAGFESTVARLGAGSAHPTMRWDELHRLHVWSCALAATVSVVCAIHAAVTA